jgi:hypothetical protein
VEALRVKLFHKHGSVAAIRIFIIGTATFTTHVDVPRQTFFDYPPRAFKCFGFFREWPVPQKNGNAAPQGSAMQVLMSHVVAMFLRTP